MVTFSFCFHGFKNNVKRCIQVPSPIVVSEKVLWRLTLYSSYPPAGSTWFHAFIMRHISIILIAINSCSTNLLQIGSWRHREQRKSQESNDWLTWIRLGQGLAFGPSAFLSPHECGCPGSSPKHSSFPSQSPERITMRTKAIEADNRLWILKYTVGRNWQKDE